MSRSQREVLETAWNTLHDDQKAPWEDLAFGEGRDRFRRFLDVEAYTDAALMLVPEGWAFTVADYWCEGEEKPPYFADCFDKARAMAGDREAPVFEAWADHPALALAAAALRAKGPGQ